MFEKNQNKDKFIRIRVTQTQKENIEKFAKDNDMNISEFILKLIQNYVDSCK